MDSEVQSAIPKILSSMGSEQKCNAMRCCMSWAALRKPKGNIIMTPSVGIYGESGSPPESWAITLVREKGT